MVIAINRLSVIKNLQQYLQWKYDHSIIIFD